MNVIYFLILTIVYLDLIFIYIFILYCIGMRAGLSLSPGEQDFYLLYHWNSSYVFFSDVDRVNESIEKGREGRIYASKYPQILVRGRDIYSSG